MVEEKGGGVAPRMHPYHHWQYIHDDSIGIMKLLQEREVYGNARMIHAACHGHGSLVRRLRCESVLDGHSGCVNHLRWNHNGTLLASGSDDHNVVIWDYATRKKREVIETGHQLNIFAVCFVPDTNDHIIASGAMDYDVRIHYAPFYRDSTKVFRVHRGRVKDIGSSWGVPKVFWTVAEDGLIYQFDVRDLPKLSTNNNSSSSDEVSDTSGILIRLGRNRRGRVLRGMGMATHPVDPTKIVVACGDFYTRLYDRRMLRVQPQTYPPRGSGDTTVNATIPVEIFAPPHLHLDEFCDATTKRRHDSSHGTSIQFNHDGSEVLANYHNDHIYLFKMNHGPHPITIYDSKSHHDLVSTGVDALKEKEEPEREEQQSQRPNWRNGMEMDRTSATLPLTKDQVKALHSKGLVALLGRNHTRAIRYFTKACSAKCLPTMSQSFRKDLYHNCAKAYLARAWNADIYLSAVHCKLALEIDPNDREIELAYIKALHSGKREAHAQWQAERYKEKYPEFDSDVTQYIREDGNRSDGGSRNGLARLSRQRSYSSDDYDSSSTESEEKESPTHETMNEEEEEPTLPADEDGFWKDNCLDGVPVNSDVVRRYIGYCNIQTDIKEATFFGDNDAYIVAGSDDGRAFIWNKATGKLVNAIKADEDIVNCAQAHPIDTCLATSGIENVIRLWTPTGNPEDAPSEADLDEMTVRNQHQMSDIIGSYFGGSMRPNIIRLVFQPGGDNEGVQECATS